ncbi:T9SS type A sorting domain-containing protein [bacterium]|nr:T9SS type A sorting domain-containing protein [bacterium]
MRYSPSRSGDYVVTFSIDILSDGEIYWEDTFADAVTGVEEDDTPLPKAVVLDQNYPNPFNPSTTITYALPTSSDVRLSVFDMLGREVSVLVNERRDAGVHEVAFDGSGLSSGVYLYRLQAGGFVRTRKLVLLQ